MNYCLKLSIYSGWFRYPHAHFLFIVVRLSLQLCPPLQTHYLLLLPIRVAICWWRIISFIKWTNEHRPKSTGSVKIKVVQHLFIQILTKISWNQMNNTTIFSSLNIYKCTNFEMFWKNVLLMKQHQFQRYSTKNFQKHNFHRKFFPMFHLFIVLVGLGFEDFRKYWYILLAPGLNYARRQLTPALPTSVSFDLPDAYQTLANGEKFLFADILLGRKKRMLLFGSPTQLEILFDSSIVLLDGTFSATPPFFDQVFTIHGTKFDCSMYG